MDASSSAINQTQDMVKSMDETIRQHDSVKSMMWRVGGSAPTVYYNQIMNRDNTPFFANGVVTTHTVDEATSLIYTLQEELSATYPAAKVVVRAFGQGPPIQALLKWIFSVPTSAP